MDNEAQIAMLQLQLQNTEELISVWKGLANGWEKRAQEAENKVDDLERQMKAESERFRFAWDD